MFRLFSAGTRDCVVLVPEVFVLDGTGGDLSSCFDGDDDVVDDDDDDDEENVRWGIPLFLLLPALLFEWAWVEVPYILLVPCCVIRDEM